MGKKFFDKSKSVTYRLVHRETGPDQFEEDQSKYAFVLVSNKKHKPSKEIREVFEGKNAKPPTAERVFPSKGPRPDWDPDVVACLDDDFDFEDPDNFLEDDFVKMANEDGAAAAKNVSRRFKYDRKMGAEEDGEESVCSDFSGAFSDDDDGSFSFKRGPKSRLTQYSMTSAITNCTEDVKFLNDKFEKLLEEYDDDQIGALDDEDIDGRSVMAENITMEEYLLKKDSKGTFIPDKCEDDLRDAILQKVVSADDKEEILVTIVVKKKSSDCVSIDGSYASSIYNQPAVIPVERKRTSSSSTVRSNASDTRLADKRIDLRKLAAMNACRDKNETAEQRRERKQQVKSQRKESRQLKKEVKVAFKNEKIKQCHEQINVQKSIGFRL